jgi:hypothetical protein
MTAAVLVAPAGGHTRRRPLVSHADLIRAVADLAPDNPERAREIAVLLGLRSAPARAVEGPAEPPAPPPEPSEVPPAFPSDSEYPAAADRGPAQAVPATLVPLAVDTQVTEDVQWLHAVGPLDQRPPGTAHETLPVEPLFEPRWTVGIVFAALATDVPGRPDVARAVAVLARGGALDRMPSLPRPSLRRGAQVLIDLGAGMEPFREDQESFVADLRRALGDERVEVLHFADCPSRGAGAPGATGWTAYRPPQGGVPVVFLTDLGLGSTAGEARPREWRAFLDDIHAEGSPCIAFVPYPRARVPRMLRSAVLVVRWDRPTTAGWVRRRRTAARR